MPTSADIRDGICNLLVRTLDDSGAGGYVVGISGGVDSALAVALCCHAVGPSRVRGLFLPSAVTPSADAADVSALAAAFRIRTDTIPIDPIIREYTRIPGCGESRHVIGNLMARTRMTLLYFAANSDSSLVCGTSNRTEYLLGYCTKFGDYAADIQPLLHLLKTEVWELARELGVPSSIITRPPTAGLWSGQTDEGDLGMTYAEIDGAIRSLEMHDWVPGTPAEEKVAARCAGSRHKRVPPPSLLVR